MFSFQFPWRLTLVEPESLVCARGDEYLSSKGGVGQGDAKFGEERVLGRGHHQLPSSCVRIERRGGTKHVISGNQSRKQHAM